MRVCPENIRIGGIWKAKDLVTVEKTEWNI